jgi:hypothetical protein
MSQPMKVGPRNYTSSSASASYLDCAALERTCLLGQQRMLVTDGYESMANHDAGWCERA